MWMPAHRIGHQCYNYLEDIQPGLAKKVFGGLVGSAVSFHLCLKLYRYYDARRTVRERGEQAKAARENLRKHLEEQGPVDTQKEEAIVNLSLKDLQLKLQKGELTAIEVLRAYQRKALKVTAEVNCVTEPIWESEAIAVELDQLRPNQRRLKPLFGIPVSIKDSIFLEGYDCHAGLQTLAFEPVEKDADVIQALKKQGAVPFVRTNFPQGLMMYSCSNPIYGKTDNPHNHKRGPGGSSGGEGALLAGGGSVIGMGTDIGGSIRIPAQFCGVFGLKPTVDRLALTGIDPLPSDGQNAVRVAVGPLARDIDGLIQVMKALLTEKMFSLDPYVPPVPFRDELFEKEQRMRIGFYTALEGVHPHPACVRAVLEARQALEARGHTVVEFDPPRPMDCLANLHMKACFGDDGEATNKLLRKDVLDKSAATSYYVGQLPRSVRYMIGLLVQIVDPPLGRIIRSSASAPRTVPEWWELVEDIEKYKREFTDLWKQKNLDAMICPGMPFPAVTSGTEDKVIGGVMYTTLYNVLDYPAGHMPVTTVTEQDVQKLKDPSQYPLTGSLEKHIKKDSEGSVGLPIGIQVVGLPFQEEVVLRVMQEIDSVLHGN